MHRRLRKHAVITAVLAAVLSTGFTSPALAALKFYYDPNSGNVSFDTTETRTGKLFTYILRINEYGTPIRFIPENLIRVTSSSLITLEDHLIGEGTWSNPLDGLFTIGNVLPSGLSEETWNGLFGVFSFAFLYGPNQPSGTPNGNHAYVDEIGGGYPPPAELFHGPPEGEFDNRWGVIDPDWLPWAHAAKLIYRAGSGEVLIDTTGDDGGYITAYILESEGAFRPENHTPIVESWLADADADTIGMAADLIEPGQYSLGNIVQPGMTLQEFESTFSSARFLSRVGFKGGSFDFEADGLAMQLVYQAIPEPSTMMILVTSLVQILLRRKQRDQ